MQSTSSLSVDDDRDAPTPDPSRLQLTKVAAGLMQHMQPGSVPVDSSLDDTVATTIIPQSPRSLHEVRGDGTRRRGEVTTKLMRSMASPHCSVYMSIEDTLTKTKMQQQNAAPTAEVAPTVASPLPALIDDVHRIETELHATREQLGILQQTVDGKMIHDPDLEFDTKMGTRMYLGIEEARKRQSKWAVILMLIAISFFFVEWTWYMTSAKGWAWSCTNLCHESCDEREAEWEKISKWGPLPGRDGCRRAPIVGFSASGYYARYPSCRIDSFTESKVRVVPTAASCGQQALQRGGIPPTPTYNMTALLLPVNRRSKIDPILMFTEPEAVAGPGTTGTKACLWLTRESKWVDAEWDVAPPIVLPANGTDTLQLKEPYDVLRDLPDAAYRDAYARWSYTAFANIDEPEEVCVPDVSVNGGIPPLHGEKNSLLWRSKVHVSQWNRYGVILGKVRNSVSKSAASAASEIGRTDMGRKAVDHDLWTNRTAEATLAILVTAITSNKSVVISNHSVILECKPEDAYCTTIQMMAVYNKDLLDNEATVLQIEVQHSQALSLTWEDVYFEVYRIKSAYAVSETLIRTFFFCWLVGLLVISCHRAYARGGWLTLLPEQCWAILFIVSVLLFINPFFGLLLLNRDVTSSGWARLAYFCEVDLSYFALYVFGALNLAMIRSMRTRSELHDVFLQLLPQALGSLCCKGTAASSTSNLPNLTDRRDRNLSIESALVFVCLVTYAVVGFVGRANAGWKDRELKQELGTTRVHSRFGEVLLITALVYGLYQIYEARRKLRSTPYLGARRRHLLLRLVYFCSFPVVVVVGLTYLVEGEGPGKHVTFVEDSVLHRKMGLLVVFSVYAVVMAFTLRLIHPNEHLQNLPCPTWREHWTKMPFSEELKEVLARMPCSPYFFVSYGEEMSWLANNTRQPMTPTESPRNREPIVANIDGAYRGEKHLFSLQLAAEMSILSQEVYLNPPLRVLLKTSKVLRRGPVPGCCVLAAAAVIPRTLFGISMGRNLAASGTPTPRAQASNQKSPDALEASTVPSFRQALASVGTPPEEPLKRRGSVLLPQAGPGPDLEVTIATSSSDGDEVDRSIDGLWKLDESAAFPRAKTADPAPAPQSGEFDDDILLADDTEVSGTDVSTEYDAPSGPAAGVPPLSKPPLARRRSTGDLAGARKQSLLNLKGGPRLGETVSGGAAALSPPPRAWEQRDQKQPRLTKSPSRNALKGTVKGTMEWLGGKIGGKDPYADCQDEYRFEPNSEAWEQNISRSFMDLPAFGWTLKSLLDRKDNRAMVVTKTVGDEGNRLILIAVVFRGTRNTTNVKSDLRISREPYEPMKDSVDGLKWYEEAPCAHTGFTDVWDNLKKDVLEVVASELRAASRTTGDVRVVCTGHSLGGALATLAAYEISIAHPTKWVSLYNYGTPRTGNTTFCRAFKKAVPDSFGLTHPSDPVPSNPPKFNIFGLVPSRYAHPYTRVRIDSYGGLLVRPSWIEVLLMEAMPFKLLEPFKVKENIHEGHSMRTYRAAIKAACNWVGLDHGLQASLDRA
eukprot:Rhum_TRINITY_DN4380_c0_g1::Rhum_TRINITY_DN4380_c0_g1_i1::g.14148::m.14148